MFWPKSHAMADGTRITGCFETALTKRREFAEWPEYLRLQNGSNQTLTMREIPRGIQGGRTNGEEVTSVYDRRQRAEAGKRRSSTPVASD